MTTMADWDVDELSAIDEQFAKTPVVRERTASGNSAGRRGSLMSKLEEDIRVGGGRTKETAAERRVNRRKSAASFHKESNFVGQESKRIPIYLLDSSAHWINILADTKVSDVIISLKEKLGLTNDADFALYAITNGLQRGEQNILDENEPMAKITDKWSAEQTDPRLLEAGDKTDSIMGGSRHLVLKRRVYLPWSPIHEEVRGAKSVTDAAHTLEYVESIYNVMRGFYPCKKPQVTELAAFMLQAECGEFDPNLYNGSSSLAAKMEYMLPPYFRHGRNTTKYAERVVKIWKSKSFKGLKPLVAQQTYMERLRSWFPFYGGEFYPCSYKRLSKGGETKGKTLDGAVAVVSHRGVYVLYSTQGMKSAKEAPYLLLVRHTFESMQQWMVSDTGMVFSFVLGPTDQCFIISPQAQEVMNLFEEYMYEFNVVTHGHVDKFPDMTADELKASSPMIRSRLYGNRADHDIEEFQFGRRVSDSMLPELPDLPEDKEKSAGDDATALPKGWVELHDDHSGHKFFFSSKRRVSVWSLSELQAVEKSLDTTGTTAQPSETVGASSNTEDTDDDWVPMKDPDSGQTYFVHKATGESSWKRQSSVNDEDHSSEEDGGDGDTDTDIRGFVTMQDEFGRTYYVNNETGESTWELPSKTINTEEAPAATTSGQWSMEYDSKHERYYYINNETGVSQWEEPEGYNTPQDSQAPKTPSTKGGKRRGSVFAQKMAEIQNQDHSDFLDGF